MVATWVACMLMSVAALPEATTERMQDHQADGGHGGDSEALIRRTPLRARLNPRREDQAEDDKRPRDHTDQRHRRKIRPLRPRTNSAVPSPLRGAGGARQLILIRVRVLLGHGLPFVGLDVHSNDRVLSGSPPDVPCHVMSRWCCCGKHAFGPDFAPPLPAATMTLTVRQGKGRAQTALDSPPTHRQRESDRLRSARVTGGSLVAAPGDLEPDARQRPETGTLGR
jgi:hypothetical protein